MSEKATAVTGITAADLKEVLTAVVEEARKPVVTEREKAEIEAMQQIRKENAEAFKVDEAAKQRRQQICDHRTRLITGADTGSAIVANKNGRGDVLFFICQHCHLVTRPEEEGKKGYVDSVLYDTQKFNQFFIEKVNTGGV